jgi:hypothetical protein
VADQSSDVSYDDPEVVLIGQLVEILDGFADSHSTDDVRQVQRRACEYLFSRFARAVHPGPLL